jgi:hypothetical protein
MDYLYICLEAFKKQKSRDIHQWEKFFLLSAKLEAEKEKTKHQYESASIKFDK